MAPDTRFGVIGAGGRLGSRILALGAEAPGIRMAGAFERADSPLVGTPVPGVPGLAYAGGLGGLKDCSVVVDVSAGAAVPAHVEACRAAGVPILVAATGLEEAAQAAIRAAAQHVAVCVAPNLGTGTWVLAHLVRQASALLADFDIEVSETHHRHKKDAPSGTALLLARHAAEGRGVDLAATAVKDRTTSVGARKAGTVGMVSLRGGDVVGDHTVFLFGEGERLELTHRAHSRDVFARGALRLAPLLAARGPGLHTVPSLLGLALPG